MTTEALPRSCKICGSDSLSPVQHTARCQDCGVLLYYPYPTKEEIAGPWVHFDKAAARKWYAECARLNHENFGRMLHFATEGEDATNPLRILDYGCGGGQFALVAKSHFPSAHIYSTDASDEALLDEWKCLQVQIPFAEFEANELQFDYIFLNDVFEHVSDPAAVLALLTRKLAPGGKIFIDTPKSFWLYPATRMIAPGLHYKLLRGTVSLAHLQIWSEKSFRLVVKKAGLAIEKYNELSEYTMPADFYLKTMGIRNPFVKALGFLFYRQSKHIARNKIMALLTK